MEKRAKQVLGSIGIIAVILFPVLYAKEIGEILGISPVNAALLVIVTYFVIGRLWKHRDKLTG